MTRVKVVCDRLTDIRDRFTDISDLIVERQKIFLSIFTTFDLIQDLIENTTLFIRELLIGLRVTVFLDRISRETFLGEGFKERSQIRFLFITHIVIQPSISAL